MHKGSPFPWAVAIIAVTVLLLALIGLKMCYKTAEVTYKGIDRGMNSVEQALDATVGKIPDIAARFLTGRITETFRSSIPTVSSTGGDVLEVATAKNDEFFSRSDERRVAWDWVYLGTTIVEIRVPVTFRYHIRLSDEWRLAARDQVCVVLAPKIRPSLPPAIHTDRLEQRAESGWARFDKNDQLEQLRSDLTRLLSRRAMEPSHLALVREASRQSIGAFVRKWLLQEGQWATNRFNAVLVVFPDEVNIQSDADLLKLDVAPTLRLEDPK